MSEATPFTRSARAYFDSGWSPIPLPHRAKSPVPDHPTPFTGARGAYVDGAQLRRWLGARARAQAGNFHYPPSNIAIRLPRDIIGLDIDAYGEKRGAATLALAEEAWGPLPQTWVSTSKNDGISGIRLFRIPEGLSWPGELPQGKGAELVRWDHRYALVAPSIHDLTCEEYRWCREVQKLSALDGEFVVELVDSPGEFPDADGADIAVLPQEWVEGLTSGKRWEEREAGDDLTDDQVTEWLLARPSPDKPCSSMRSVLSKGKTKIQTAGDDGGAHDVARDVAWGLINDSKAGHAGIRKALGELRNVFLQAVKGRRDSERQAKTEWARIVRRGIGKVEHDGNAYEVEDPCESIKAKSGPADGSAPRMGSGDVFPNDDPGNAARLFRTVNGRARWVPGWKCWAIWQGDRWARDKDGQMQRWAVKTVRDMSQEIALMDGYADETVIKAQRAHQKSSGAEARLNAMQNVMKTRKGVTIQAEAFDADPRLIVCPNGTLELLDDGVKFRPSNHEDYNTIVAGADYEPSARHPLWEDYLKRFHPDDEVRDWLQRLVGYSLFGANDEQLLIVGLGRTSTGKTTFTEGIFAALGGYAGPLEATVLKTSGDDKPRPDILKALSRRIVIAEELSEFQKLHVDQVKRITGAGTLSARGMNSDVYVERKGAFTPWIMTNDVPTIQGADAAIRSRVIVVPFDVAQARSRAASAVRRRILAEARPAILAWAVEGYVKSLGGDLRETPLGAIAANAKFAEGLSELHAFVADRCEMGDGMSTLGSALFEAYQVWCTNNQIPERDQLNPITFGRRMTAMGTEVTRKRTGDSGKQQWHRLGIRLTAG